MISQSFEATLDSRANSALANSPYFLKRKPLIEATEGRVVLKGSVPSFYLKQVAQEVLRRVDGIEHIENLLQVESR